MGRAVVLLRHGHDTLDDLAARFLAANGFRLLNVHPASGPALPDPHDPDLVAAIVYGGLESANDDHHGSPMPAELAFVEHWLSTGKPYFGVCLGAQMLARVLGAPIAAHPQGLHEVGYTRVRPAPGADTFLSADQHFYQWHKEAFAIPHGCRRLAGGDVYENQAFCWGSNAYGVQFHPEVTESMMRHWLTSSGHLLAAAPGAHPIDKQLTEAPRFIPAAQRWLEGFLGRWLKLHD